MKKIVKISAISLVIIAVGATAVNASARWGENCERGGMHGGQAKMMKHMGKHGRYADRDLDLNAEEAKTLVEAKLIMRGNDRLKVGQVVEKDEDVFLIDIVTVDNSLVRQIEVDRDKGLPRGPFNHKK